MGTIRIRRHIYFCCVVDGYFNYHSSILKLNNAITNHDGIDECLKLLDEKYPFPIKTIVSLSYFGKED